MKIWKISALVFFIASLIYYLVTPVTGDIYVFFGSSHLAQIQYGGGFGGAILSWELKPFANRIFMYIIYRITSIFAAFGTNTFIFASKIIYLFLLILAAWCLTEALNIKYKFERKNKIYILLALSGVLLSFTFRAIMQVEYTCLLLSLISIYLLLADSRIKNLSGIAVLSIIPFFKGITIIFCMQVIILLYGFFGVKLKKLFKITGICAAVCLVIVLCFYVFYPQELFDLKNAVYFQSTLNQTIKSFIKVCITSTEYVVYTIPLYPLLLTSILCLIYYVYRRKTFLEKGFISLVLAWLAGYFFAVVQNKFYVYHFAGWGLPMIFSAISMFDYDIGGSPVETKRPIFKTFAFSLTGLCLLWLFFVNSPLQNIINLNPISGKYAASWDYVSMKGQINTLNRISEFGSKLDKDGEVLYLDEGTGVWCLGMKSASKYFIPLPVQRAVSNRNLAKKEVYTDMVSLMNSYSGKYIFLSPGWFDINKLNLDKFKQILDDYTETQIESTGYLLYIKK